VLPNPYAPGALPGYLAGRGRELDEIRTKLARMKALRRSGGPLLAFYGSRGLGKTSLLRSAQREARGEGYLTVWATGRADVDLAPQVVTSLADEIRRESPGERAKGLLQRLDKIQLEVGVPGAKVGVELAGAPRGGGDIIGSTLQDAARFASNHDRAGVAVFVDELQEAPIKDRGSLLVALQHFDGEGDPVTIVAAGLPSVIGAVPEAATFGERSTFREVGLLTDVAVAEALLLPASDLGVGWSVPAIDEAVTAAQGYPHRVQLIGEAAWHTARPESGSQIEVGHVRQGLEAADEGMASLFRSRMTKTTEPQRRFLNAMAAEGDGPVKRASIAQRLKTSTTSLSDVRDQLIDRGLVEPGAYGELRFTIPGFGAFLRAQAQHDTIDPAARSAADIAAHLDGGGPPGRAGSGPDTDHTPKPHHRPRGRSGPERGGDGRGR